MDETRTDEPRIEAERSDAPPAGPDERPEATRANGGAPSEDRVREALKQVVDPELGINIVDLGLVYDIDIAEDGRVHIEYTLTTMGCPIGPLIEHQMQSFLAAVPGVAEVTAEMAIRPAWSPEMMSEEAKAALGYF